MLTTVEQATRLDGCDLVARIACGDQVAFAQLYDLFSADAFGVAMRMLRDRALAEDAIQETFLAVWRHAASYKPELAGVRTWIVIIARRRSIDLLRRRNARSIEAPFDGLMEPAETDVGAEVLQRLERDAMTALMAQLPSEQRHAIELAFLLGLTHAEIARETGAPLGTVKSRVRLGLQRIRWMIGESRRSSNDAAGWA